MADVLTIEQRVKESVAECIHGGRAEDVRKDHHLVDDLGFDSLDFTMLELDLEERFSLRIADSDIRKMETVDHVIGYIMENMSKSKIEWTDETWNPVTGCTKVSQGCKHCYAERIWPRLSANPKHVAFGRGFTDVQCHPERLEQPLRWKRPRMVFVNSMSDLFHEDVPDEFIILVFSIMNNASQHTFQVLTKRPKRMHSLLSQLPVVPNVWLGVSVEDQATADERIPLLLQTPASVRWISAEPLLGHITLQNDVSGGESSSEPSAYDGKYHCRSYLRGVTGDQRLNWVVVGGESGPKARPMHPDWARSLRDQCKASGVPFFFKQWGEWSPDESDDEDILCGEFHENPHEWILGCSCIEGTQSMYRVGKKAAGCLLDGVEHKEWPNA